MSDCMSRLQTLCVAFDYFIFTHAVGLFAVISRTFHDKNELKESKTFPVLSHFSFDFKQGFSYFAVFVCQSKKGEAFW